ncbi:RsmF rRNA methyltransferase first C-terminal domain-containing protein [Streptococcus caviae]|uniref:RsmF rRNA methyltransferase first C-terminal domain-containing protein n=1 Tax=Streptococcus sp. 'caviae' TaxID=1915004 RepID=UPI00094BC10E|nr:RsmB/NOP family class I SAM-dependent RNA methyltransferase [Streptococcus sp. 'caviae']OLN82618.1 RNA methyltransferase [Streptococcus sp. 'caviae']
MSLPEKFVEKYHTILGSEAEAFFASFKEEAVAAFRVNPLKGTQISFENPIPNTDWGHYGKVSGRSAEHVSGLVYSQEPAAQMVAQAAAPAKGMKVLDLAAAPGGKTTHLLSYLDNTGILVSNEISKKRSKVLVENVERFGARNVIVTNESPKNLAQTFAHYFDLIVLDAPCSGEGMFRKDPAAMQYWHEDYPAECADLQKEILQEAVKMLAFGGSLVYSTCTWAPEENEDIIRWLLSHYDYLELEDVPKINGMTEGIDMPEAARMYPHRFKGEGQFVAKLRDKRRAQPSLLSKNAKSYLKKDQEELWQIFADKYLKVKLEGLYQTFGNQLYLVPQGLPNLSTLKIARNGLHLGTFKKNRFEPSFALGLALKKGEVVQSVEIDVEQFKTYVSGNVLPLSKDYENGWYQILINGNGLGFAKVTGNTLKNYFPKGLRFQV